MAIAQQAQKLLRQIADTLPTVFYTVQESQVWSGKDLLLTGYESQADIDPNQEYTIDSPVNIASNHYRRMKKLYQSHGVEAVNAYVQKVNELFIKSQSNN